MICANCTGPITQDQLGFGPEKYGIHLDSRICLAFAVQKERERCLAWVGAFAKDCGCSDEIKKKIEGGE